MKKYLIITVLALITVGVLFSAFSSRRNSAKSAEETATSPLPISVKTLSMQDAKQSLSQRSFSSSVTNEGEAKIIAQTSGTVLADSAILGSSVGVGQMLYRIDTTGGAVSPETGFESPALLEAKLALKNAEESYEQAKREYERNESQSLKTARDIQKNLRDSARARYTALLDTQNIKSPIAGTVTQKFIALGDTTTPGTILAVIGNGKKVVQFYASFDEKALLSLKQSIDLFVETGTDKTPIRGFISRISPSADTASRRFLVEVVGTGKEFSTLPAGSIVTAKVSLTRTASNNSFLLPLSALLEEQNGTFVFIAKGDHAKRQAVHIENIYGETVEVSGEFPADTQFIVTNAKRLTDGSGISVVSQ